MKKIYLLLLFSFFARDLCSQHLQWDWAKEYGHGYGQEVKAIAADSFGNCFVAGYFNGDTIRFRNIFLSSGVPFSQQHFFVAKFDSAGYTLWAKTSASNTGNEKATAVAVDGDGNCYVVVQFVATLIIGNDTLTNNGSGGDLCLIKYDTAGNILWMKQIKSSSLDVVLGMTVDGLGNSFITGNYSGDSLTFDNTSIYMYPLTWIQVGFYF